LPAPERVPFLVVQQPAAQRVTSNRHLHDAAPATMLLADLQSITAYEVYVWLLRLLISVAVSTSVVVSASRLLIIAKFCFYSCKSRWWRSPEAAYAFATLPSELHAKPELYPTVAVQLPMFNELSVCETIINCACELHWPRSRLCVQVRQVPAHAAPLRLARG